MKILHRHIMSIIGISKLYTMYLNRVLLVLSSWETPGPVWGKNAIKKSRCPCQRKVEYQIPSLKNLEYENADWK